MNLTTCSLFYFYFTELLQNNNVLAFRLYAITESLFTFFYAILHSRVDMYWGKSLIVEVNMRKSRYTHYTAHKQQIEKW